jgi:SNF2 family DNA or RNA helicase
MSLGMQVAIYGEHVIMNDAAGLWVRQQQVPTQYMDVGGKQVESMPHTLDAVRLFRNMGTELPTPMKANGYAFPGRFPPFKHQLDTADFMAGYDRCFVLNSPGTGKTAAAIWAADYLMQQGVIRKVLVLCPMSCMGAVWADELFNCAPHATQAVIHGPKATRIKLAQSGARWLICNHDGVKVMEEHFIADPEIDLVIIDECTAFKAEGADRTKALKKVVANRRVWAMTGTPIPQNPVDAYLMAKLINPHAPQYKYQFQDLTMMKVNKFKWVARADATDKVYSVMQPAIRFDKKDCLDMPKVMVEHRRVDLTAQQTKAIEDIKKDWVVDVANRSGQVSEVTTQNAAIRLGKILQICEGIIINNDSEVLDISSEPRQQACYDAVMESDSKAVVFVPYKGAIEKLYKYLKSKGVSCAVVNGDVSEARRRVIFREFQDLADPQVLLAHPKTTAHGLTLTAASTTIWYGPTFSAETYEQANNRTNRPGQLHDMRIIHLHSVTQESAIYKALAEMNDLQGVLLDLYRRVLEE